MSDLGLSTDKTSSIYETGLAQSVVSV